MKYICCALALLLTLAVCCWVVILRISSLTEEIHLLLQEAGVALRLEQSEYDIAVQYWTINDEEAVKTLTENGADCIMTDYPEMAFDAVKECQ